MTVTALRDGYRCGGPQKFSVEQVAAIMTLAHESPQDIGPSILHWTAALLACGATMLSSMRWEPSGIGRFDGSDQPL